MISLRRCLSVAAVAVAMSLATSARADDPSPDTLAEAKKLYDEGSQAFSRGEYDVAVTKLQRSFDLVPSPTAELVLARALREDNKLVPAATHFAACEVAARARVAKGDARFSSTVDDAASEGAALRAKVAAFDVVVIGAAAGDVVEIEGRTVPVEQGQVPTQFHEPGPVTVTYRPAHGAPVPKIATLEAGKTASLSFGEVEKPPPPPSGGGGRKKWAVPAAIAAGGVTAVGAGLFIGFGLKSSSIYGELSPCAGHCPRAQYESKAKSGASAQAVANAGLAIGLVGAAATVTFTVLAVADKSGKPAPKAALSISPTGAFVVGDF
jgi:hypothetical protein